jgi:hypothetical protein
MSLHTLVYVALNIMAIIVCGAAGAGAGYGVVHSFALSGVVGAIVATAIGMVVATAAWAGGSSLLRAAGLIH